MAKIQTYNKGSAEMLDPDDLTALTDLAVTSLKRHGGRIAKYTNDEDGLEKFVQKSAEFFEYCNRINAELDPQKRLIPDVESWCCFLGLTRTAIFAYSKRSQQWNETIEMIKEYIAMAKKQLGMRNRIPQMVLVFDLANNHNYKNTSEFHISADAPQDTHDTPRLSEVQLSEIATDCNPQLPE